MLTTRKCIAGESQVVASKTRAGAGCCLQAVLKTTGVRVNDVHSKLNRTTVRRIVKPRSLAELQGAVQRARVESCTLSVAGGRHAMGGQQFGRDAILIDMSAMNRVLDFNPVCREVTVEAGIEWPRLIRYLLDAESNRRAQLGIIQKQTGADRLSIGGALAANVHGRGLRLKPIIRDIKSFVIVDAEGRARTCSRQENHQLFQLAIGGYGLFGIIAVVTLRLVPRQKLRRRVEIVEVSDVMHHFEQSIKDGALYGDFQFMTDSSADGFLRQGILSSYETADSDTAADLPHQELSADDWKQLLYLAHTDRERAWQLYSQHYLSTSGQLYWSDTHQLSVYLDNYHQELDERLGAAHPGSEMITEVYVPRRNFIHFMDAVRADFRQHCVDLIYGTVRLIERDDESFLAWAKENYVCIVFNLHVEHNRSGIRKAQRDFRRLIDRAIEYEGSYYLTYHRWATRAQVESCYPQFQEFLRLKRKYDPAERFRSDWYWHYKQIFHSTGP